MAKKAEVTITLTVTVQVPDTWPNDENALTEKVEPYLSIAVSSTSPKLKVASDVVFNIDDVELQAK